jgi:predicted alpha/beta superfamily hydrolase
MTRHRRLPAHVRGEDMSMSIQSLATSVARQAMALGFVGLVLITNVAAQERLPAGDYPPVALMNTEVRRLQAVAVEGMEYLLFVSLPEGYDDSRLRYPALYLLDAWDEFGILAQAHRWQVRAGLIRPSILVGIAHEGDFSDYMFNRARDFMPTFVPQDSMPPWMRTVVPTSGGGPAFLRFLEDELFPFIESAYRVDTAERLLVGQSAGGLFATWVMFAHPGLFSGFGILSPALFWDDWTVLDDERTYAATHGDLSARVFLAVGGQEGGPFMMAFDRIKAALESRGYPSLYLEAHSFPDEEHVSVIPAAFSRALRVLLAEPEPQ